MKIFLILATLVIMLIGFVTIGFFGTVLVAASGAMAYHLYCSMSNGNGSSMSSNSYEAGGY